MICTAETNFHTRQACRGCHDAACGLSRTALQWGARGACEEAHVGSQGFQRDAPWAEIAGDDVRGGGGGREGCT